MNAALQTKAQAPTRPGFTPAPSGFLHRKCACSGAAGVTSECEDCNQKKLSVQRSTRNAEHETRNAERETQSSSGVPHIVNDVLSSPGQALDSETRNFFESRFGHDFSRVRVHTDANAANSARAVNALAYTVGRDVAFGAGQYAPQTDAGRKLLAHELTHVVQQGSGPSSGPAGNESHPVTVGPSHGALEAEAHRMAESYNWNQPSVSVWSQRILQRQDATTPETPAPSAPAVCPVTAITAYGPPDRPPAGNEGMTAATITAMGCLETAVTNAGGTMSITTRFRSQPYQDHLVEVWDKTQAPARTEPECAAVMENYAMERTRHYPMGEPARTVSNHTRGTAFDATVTLPETANLDTLQTGCGLTRPVADEPWHFET